MTLDDLQEGLEQGKKLTIRGYVKPKNRYRLSDEVVDVTIDTQIPSYDILKRQSLSEVKRIPLNKVVTIAKKHGGTKEDAEKALNEVTASLEKTSSGSSGRFSDPKYTTIAPYVNFNSETGDIYFTGKKVSENKLSTSSYKDKNSRAKTLIKNELQKDLPNKLKVWKVNVDDIDKIEFV